MVEVLGYLAMVISWVALYLCKDYRFGWLLSGLVWLLWFPYGFIIHSVPVMINTSVYAIVSLINWKNWSKHATDCTK